MCDETMKQLGHFEVPERTFEFDVQVQERYQSFSAETLRLSLLGIAAVGFIAVNTFLGKANDRVALDAWIRLTIMVSLVSFGLSTIASLYHRYFVVEMLSWQLQSLRRDQRAMAVSESGDADSITEQELELANSERKQRYGRFVWSRRCLVAGAAFLATGGVCLAVAFCGVVWKL